jgi:hypothetical protein
LRLSDGRRNALQIARELHLADKAADVERTLKWIENLFVSGLLRLEQHGSRGRLDSAAA